MLQLKNFNSDIYILTLCFILLSISQSDAFEFSGQVIDGLNRPYENFEIELFRFDNDKRIIVKKVITDKDGIFKAEVEGNKANLLYGFTLTSGYSVIGKFSSEIDPSWNLKIIQQRPPSLKMIRNLSHIQQNNLESKMLEILSSGIYEYPMNEAFIELFKINEHIEPAIVSIIEGSYSDNRYVRDNAVILLSYFANPRTIKQVLFKKLTKWINEEIPEIEKAYISYIASTLLSLSTEEEWLFLEENIKTLKNRAIAQNALNTLKAISNERSLNILKSAELHIESEINTNEPVSIEKDPVKWDEIFFKKYFLKEISNAIKFKKDHPKGIIYSSNINISIKNASEIIIDMKAKEKFKIDRVIYDRKGNKAFVSGFIQGLRYSKNYHLVFHKIGSVWILKGIWLIWMT